MSKTTSSFTMVTDTLKYISEHCDSRINQRLCDNCSFADVCARVRHEKYGFDIGEILRFAYRYIKFLERKGEE